MIVSNRYVLGRLLTHEGTYTYEARQLRSGHALWVHLLRGGNTTENQEILFSMQRLSEPARSLFIDAGEHEGTLYLVTWPLPGFHSLHHWLRTRESLFSGTAPDPDAHREPRHVFHEPDAGGRGQNGTADTLPAPGATVHSGPGEFSSFSGSRPKLNATAFGIPEGELESAPETRPRGDFTRMFGRLAHDASWTRLDPTSPIRPATTQAPGTTAPSVPARRESTIVVQRSSEQPETPQAAPLQATELPVPPADRPTRKS